MDNILKMGRHSRKSKVLHGTKMFPCVTIYWTEHFRDPILGTSWLPLKLYIHFITSTNKLSIPCSWKSTQTFEVLQRAFQALSCHSGFKFPTKIRSPYSNHKQGDVCRMSNNVPFSYVPLPSLLIIASLQEIYHLLGEHVHNRA